MKRKKLPKSVRKYICKEKARIHRGVLGLKEQQRLIDEIYKKFLKPSIKTEKEVKKSG